MRTQNQVLTKGKTQCLQYPFFQIHIVPAFSTLLKSVHSLRLKTAHLELISLIFDRKRTLSPLSSFSSGQAGETALLTIFPSQNGT